MSRIAGLVLAAGAGTRFGGPKALARTPSGVPWLRLAVATLAGAGCSPVHVVLGAGADAARALVPRSAAVVVAEDWSQGLSASVGAGLRSLAEADSDAVLISLVDLPGLPVAACSRLLHPGVDPTTLRQATYGGAPGHPVLIGQQHWCALLADLRGDRGAGAYLAATAAERVECSDLFSGADADRPPAIA